MHLMNCNLKSKWRRRLQRRGGTGWHASAVVGGQWERGVDHAFRGEEHSRRRTLVEVADAAGGDELPRGDGAVVDSQSSGVRRAVDNGSRRKERRGVHRCAG